MTDPIEPSRGARGMAGRLAPRVESVPTVVATTTDLDGMFRDHYPRLVQALTLVAGDRDTAADAVQEAFVAAHLKWRTVQHYEDPVGWIRRVAINKLRDGHRRAGRTTKVLARLHLRGDHGATDADATHRDFEHGAGAGDAVMPALAELPRQQRLCIALFYVDGLPVAEIAEALSISEGAVKFHLHQGRERLRTQLPPNGSSRQDTSA
jgi:RNA polymerase sigma factor (sigma-70 family)